MRWIEKRPTSFGRRAKKWWENRSHHFFALLPKDVGRFSIHRIRAHSFGHGTGRHFIRDDLGHKAVLAIPPSNFTGWSNHTGPHRSRCPLRHALLLQGHLTRVSKLLIDLIQSRL